MEFETPTRARPGIVAGASMISHACRGSLTPNRLLFNPCISEFIQFTADPSPKPIFVSMHLSRRLPAVLIFLLGLSSTFIVAGCGILGKAEKTPQPSSPYPPLPGFLDQEYFHSPSGDIAGKFPAGWLRVNVASIPMEHVLFVYSDPDRRTALVLSELPATADFRRNVERDGISALSDQSFANKVGRVKGLSIVHPTDVYTIGSKLFATYEYAEPVLGGDSTARRVNRVALFTTGARFYELAMVELANPQSPAEHITNFRLLESVIGSLEGVAQVGGLSDDRTSGDSTGAF